VLKNAKPNNSMKDPIRGSIWRSNVHTSIGLLLVASCALVGSLAIIKAVGMLTRSRTAFAQVIDRETTLPN
jgi:hypothetical protein